MTTDPVNLPNNEDPRPETGSLVPGSPAAPSSPAPPQDSAKPAPTQSLPSIVESYRNPPPMPELTVNRLSRFPSTADIEDIAIATVTSALKKIRINGQPGVSENGTINFSTPTIETKTSGPIVASPVGPIDTTLTPENRAGGSRPYTEAEVSSADTNNSNRIEKFMSRQTGETSVESRNAEVSAKAKQFGQAQSNEGESANPLSRSGSSTEVKVGLEQAMDNLSQGYGRLNGESTEDYKERMEILRMDKNEKDPEKRAENVEKLNRYAEKHLEKVDLKNGVPPNAYIPLVVSRGDGRTQSLIYVKSAATVDAQSGVDRDASDYFGYSHPFKILLKKDNSGVYAGVVYYSHLFKQRPPSSSSKQTITGLLSTASDSGTDGNVQGTQDAPASAPSAPSAGGQVNQETPPSTQSTGINGWVSIIDGDKVYLEIGVSDGDVTSADIKVGTDFDTSAGPWISGSYVERDQNSGQTKARYLIGEMTNDLIEQYATTNLVMQSLCINGISAIYPVPL